jgi:hypothetical protein
MAAGAGLSPSSTGAVVRFSSTVCEVHVAAGARQNSLMWHFASAAVHGGTAGSLQIVDLVLRWYLLPGLPQVYYIGIIDILMLCAPPSLSTRCTARPIQLALSLGRVHTRMLTRSHATQTDARMLTRAYGRMHAHTRAQTSPACTVVFMQVRLAQAHRKHVEVHD